MATLHIPKAQITFKNFEGREAKYNPPGNRSFALLFDEAGLAEVPIGEWQVKFIEATNKHHQPLHLAYILVKVRFDEIMGRDLTPKVLLTLNGDNIIETRELDQDTIKILDWAPYRYCDVTIHSQPWELGGRNSGKKGIMAILDKFHATVG